MRTVCSFQPIRLLDPIRWLFLFSVVSSIAVLPAVAQIDRAVLEGTVLDPSGAAIIGASVKILAVNTQISQEQHTNSRGYYRFPGVALGSHTVTATSRGIKTKVVEEVILRVGQPRTLDVTLEVGGSTEKVEVQASSSPSNRSSTEASTVIDASQIANLPNNGRDWASLTLLAPFAQDDGGGDQRTIRFAGRRATTTTFKSMGSMPGESRSRPRNRRPGCRSRRMRSSNTVSTALCTMRSTAPRRVARSTSSPSRGRTSFMAVLSAT